MISRQGETYNLSIYKRKENSDYEWETTPYATIKCRTANNMEKKLFRVQQGVNSSEDSVFIFATNLPKDIQVKDKALFLGKEWTIASIGYYFDNSRLINASIMSDDYIISRCPKGLSLQ